MRDVVFPDVVLSEGRTVEEIRVDLEAQLADGARAEDQRIAAGRLAGYYRFTTVDETGKTVERTVDRLPAGSTLFGVLVV